VPGRRTPGPDTTNGLTLTPCRVDLPHPSSVFWLVGAKQFPSTGSRRQARSVSSWSRRRQSASRRPDPDVPRRARQRRSGDFAGRHRRTAAWTPVRSGNAAITPARVGCVHFVARRDLLHRGDRGGGQRHRRRRFDVPLWRIERGPDMSSGPAAGVIAATDRAFCATRHDAGATSSQASRLVPPSAARAGRHATTSAR
jgi:hypothetical protein